MLKSQIKAGLENKCLLRAEQGATSKELKIFIAKSTGFKKTKVNEIYNKIFSQTLFAAGDARSEEFWEENLEVLEKPYFNKDTKQYIVFLNCLGRNIVVSEAKHKSILQSYSNWDGEERTIGQICKNIQWPRPVLTEYLKKFGINHDSLPVTDEDLNEQSDVELLARLTELRKFSLDQKFEKESWAATQKEAYQWREFQYKTLDPLKTLIDKWVPPKNEYKFTCKKSGKQSLLVTLADLHFGMLSKKDETFRQLEMNSNVVAQRVISLANQIKEDVKKQDLKEINVLFLGDLLNSANSQGTTNRGTVLQNDLVGGAMFKLALDTLANFLNILLSTGVKVTCLGITGNHDAVLGLGLLYALEAYFKKEIKFFINHQFIGISVIQNSLIAFSHGAHWDIKTKVPTGRKVQNYAQSVFLQADKILKDQKINAIINSRYLIVGDLHHSMMTEHNDFEYILVPSIAGGSNFSDALNLNSRARQQTFLFNEEGIKSVNNYYFD